jgi:hypothetical protein
MRAQTSATLISLLIASVAVGLHQIEFHLPGLKQVAPAPLLAHPQLPNSTYLSHRGSGRLEDHRPLFTLAVAVG